MTTKDLQAGITGAYIVMLLSHLSIEDRHKGSVIKMRDRIMSKLLTLPKTVAKLADKAYESTKERYKDEEIELDIGILIETLAFNKEEYMKEFYGGDIISLVERASIKIQLDGLTSKQMRDSYGIADQMKKDFEKVVFEYQKDK